MSSKELRGRVGIPRSSGDSKLERSGTGISQVTIPYPVAPRNDDLPNHTLNVGEGV